MTQSSLFRKIKAALDSEDIEGLVALGAPSDEYESEASLIAGRIAKLFNSVEKSMNAGQVEAIVAEVWNLQFGPLDANEFNKRRLAFCSVARKIASEL